MPATPVHQIQSPPHTPPAYHANMIIPTDKPNPAREDFVRGFVEGFRMTREEAEKKTQLYIDLDYFRPCDEVNAP